MTDQYMPRFITQTDEPGPWNDCQVASCLMLVDAATLGRCFIGHDGDPFDSSEMRTFRERVRDRLGPARQTGGLSLDDMAEAIELTWPKLPQLPRYTGNLDLSFDEVWTYLEHGYVAVLNGKPSYAPKGSPLRAFTDTDTGHAIYVDRVGKRNRNLAYVMDPLGRGGYDGRWVPKIDLAEFIKPYGTAGDRAVALVKRGAWAKFFDAPDAQQPDPTRELSELRFEVAALREERKMTLVELQRTGEANGAPTERIISIRRRMRAMSASSGDTAARLREIADELDKARLGVTNNGVGR